jgi:tetratricopeptide (TPR) repeat protein
VTEPVEVEVKLQYRKFDTRLMRHVQGDAFAGNHLPVVTLASDRVVFPVTAKGNTGSQQSRIPQWQRWNDYGIGLLREGDSGSTKGELRQAEAAFSEVEGLGRSDGPLNLARVYFKEGRLEDTVAALQRAETAGGYPWVLAWYAALVDREYGRLDAAIERLEALVETRFDDARQRGFDFSRDIRVLNLLGRTLFEKARRERGEARREERNRLLNAARSRLEQVLQIDPEDVNAHHNLALVTEQLGDSDAAARHREAHERYRVDDLAVATAVARHRSLNAAADHAAQPIAIYDLGRAGIAGVRL